MRACPCLSKRKTTNFSKPYLQKRSGVHLLAYCVMPNHWHLVVHTRKDGDLTKFVNWLTLTHTKRWHSAHKTIGHGHLYQGRYKSFLCEQDDHFMQLVRYVERNQLRARLVKKAEGWQWGSVWRREKGTLQEQSLLSEWPVSIPKNYITLLNEPQSEVEVEAMRQSIARGNPFGSDSWVRRVIKRYDLETTVRPLGRPKKGS